MYKRQAFNWGNNATQPSRYDWWLTHNVLVNQRIFYGATVLHPTDRLSFILGGRLTEYSWLSLIHIFTPAEREALAGMLLRLLEAAYQ